MRTVAVTVVFLLTLSAAGSCESLKVPVVTFVSGHGWDVYQSKQAFNRGCIEGNTMHSSAPSVGYMVVTKAVVVSGGLAAMWMLKRSGHAKAAATVGYAFGAVGWTAGTLNLRCGR